MVRCAKCRFLFEWETPGLLPACRQCGGATVLVGAIEPEEAPPALPTLKFAVIKADGVAR
ncbi:MAG TPA: hypothetical protein VF997_18115 [Polyangia bacterium]